MNEIITDHLQDTIYVFVYFITMIKWMNDIIQKKAQFMQKYNNIKNRYNTKWVMIVLPINSSNKDTKNFYKFSKITINYRNK